MHAMKKGAINLKEGKQGYMRRFGGRKGNGKTMYLYYNFKITNYKKKSPYIIALEKSKN